MRKVVTAQVKEHVSPEDENTGFNIKGFLTSFASYALEHWMQAHGNGILHAEKSGQKKGHKKKHKIHRGFFQNLLHRFTEEHPHAPDELRESPREWLMTQLSEPERLVALIGFFGAVRKVLAKARKKQGKKAGAVEAKDLKPLLKKLKKASKATGGKKKEKKGEKQRAPQIALAPKSSPRKKEQAVGKHTS
jgi:hypothetical protein